MDHPQTASMIAQASDVETHADEEPRLRQGAQIGALAVRMVISARPPCLPSASLSDAAVT